jgi:hypothetical protein
MEKKEGAYDPSNSATRVILQHGSVFLVVRAPFTAVLGHELLRLG